MWSSCVLLTLKSRWRTSLPAYGPWRLYWTSRGPEARLEMTRSVWQCFSCTSSVNSSLCVCVYLCVQALSVELLSVLHRLMVTRESQCVQLAVVNLLQQIVTAAQEHIREKRHSAEGERSSILPIGTGWNQPGPVRDSQNQPVRTYQNNSELARTSQTRPEPARTVGTSQIQPEQDRTSQHQPARTSRNKTIPDSKNQSQPLETSQKQSELARPSLHKSEPARSSQNETELVRTNKA